MSYNSSDMLYGQSNFGLFISNNKCHWLSALRIFVWWLSHHQTHWFIVQVVSTEERLNIFWPLLCEPVSEEIKLLLQKPSAQVLPETLICDDSFSSFVKISWMYLWIKRTPVHKHIKSSYIYILSTAGMLYFTELYTDDNHSQWQGTSIFPGICRLAFYSAWNQI